jgi:dTDP-4-amino-4,6-dideoxygalactose transaminase
MKMLANHGRLDKYEHQMPGYNYRMDPLQAAILSVKLKHLDDWLERRRAHVRLYNTLFAESDILTPVERSNNRHVYTYYVIRTKKRDAVMQALKNNNIDAIIHYPLPLHLQPAFRNLGYKLGDFPIAEQAAHEILSLPLYPEMTTDHIQQIAEQVLRA